MVQLLKQNCLGPIPILLYALDVCNFTFCHSLLRCILAKLFNLFIRCGHVPAAFGISYTVPLLKGSSSNYSKNFYD